MKALGEFATGDSLDGLARLDSATWIDLASKHGVPAMSSVGAVDYAFTLERKVEELYPTATLTARLEQSRFGAALPQASKIQKFFASNTQFDIVDSSIEAYLEKASEYTSDDKAEIKKALLPLQRLKRLSASWDETARMINAGIQSLSDVIDAGQDGVADALGGDGQAGRAKTIHDAAKRARDTALLVMAKGMPRFNPTGIASNPVLRNMDLSLLKDYPSLRALFGDPDTCACSSCQSVLSPSAYFVDLLQLLKISDNPSWTHPAFIALITRRPDLVDLDLSCENTDTEVPQIDLALEILENAAALPIIRTLAPGTDVPALFRSLSNEQNPIRAMMKETSALIPQHLDVKQELPLGSAAEAVWTVSGDGLRWTFRHREEGFVATVYPKKNFVPREIRLKTAPDEHEDLINTLDAGQEPANSSDLFKEIASIKDARNDNWPFIGATVRVLSRGEQWELTIRRSVRVRVVGGQVGALILEGPDGTQILTQQYQRGEPSETARSLSAGEIGRVLWTLLPAMPPQYEFRIIQEVVPSKNNNNIGVWRLEASFAFNLKFLRDEVVLTSLAYQSSHKAKHPLIEPEYRNPAAYTKLASAPFPWSLPFDLPFEATRRYLNYLGSGYSELIDRMSGADPWDEARIDRASLVQEVLGIAPEEQNLIATPAQGADLWRRWGLTVDQNNKTTILDTSIDKPVTGTPLEVLQRVSILLQQSRLRLEELDDVLQTRFVTAALSPVVIKPEKGCKTSELKVEGLAEPHLDRIHRFIRLMRRTGWSAYELDLAIEAVEGFGHGFTDTLRFIAHLKRLQERLRLNIEVLAAWWLERAAPAHRAHTVKGQPLVLGLYDRIFLNPSLQNPPNPLFELNPDRRELASVGTSSEGNEGDILQYVAAALGTRASEIEELLMLMRTPAQQQVPLKLMNLMRLHSEVTFCRALGISAADYRSLRQISSLSLADPKMCWKLCDLVEDVRNSGFTIGEVAYLLLHDENAAPAITLSMPRQRQILEDLRTKLLDQRAEIQANFDAQPKPADAAEAANMQLEFEKSRDESLSQRVASELAAAVGLDEPTARELLSRYLKEIDQSPNRSAAELFISSDFLDNGYDLRLMSVGTTDGLRNHGRNLVIVALVGSDLHIRIFDTKGEKAVDKAENKLVSGKTLNALKKRLSPIPDESDLSKKDKQKIIIDAASIAGYTLDNPPPEKFFRWLLQWLLKLHKAALIVQRMDLAGARLTWLAPNTGGDALNALNFSSMPVAASLTADPALFTAWRKLCALSRIRYMLSGSDDLISAYVTAFSSGTGWQERAHQALANTIGISVPDVAAAARLLSFTDDSYRNPIAVASLVEMLVTLKRLDATESEAHRLAAVRLTKDDILLARKLLHAKLGETKSAEVIKQVTDELRIRQRDALVDYLVHREGLRNAEQLYEYFLIDPKVSPKLKTTRILQSTQSVQLFVQRCLLQQEVLVSSLSSLTPTQRQRWEWMKNYRVWEANRKVFLYPENWLYPELREDKTEAFRELEVGLGGDEFTEEVMAKSFLDFISRLDEASKIHVVGMYSKWIAGRLTLFVVGRTLDQPSEFFWRKCTNFYQNGMSWSGWEKVGCDITSDHILPIVLDECLYVAWPVITETKDKQGPPTLKVSLKWAQLTGKGWIAKSGREHSPEISVATTPYRDHRSLLAFRVQNFSRGGSECAQIRCYAAELPQDMTIRPGHESEPAKLIFDGPVENQNGTLLRFDVRVYLKYNDNTFGYPAPGDISFEMQGFQVWGNTITDQNQASPYNLFESSTWYPTYGRFVIGHFDNGVLAEAARNGAGTLFNIPIRAVMNSNPPKYAELTVQAKAGYYRQYDLEFIIDTNKGAPQTPLTRDDTPLPMKPQGDFILDPYSDLEFQQALANVPNLVPPSATQSWMSGFRESSMTGLVNEFRDEIDTIFNGTSGERYFVSLDQSGQSSLSIWHFYEGMERYFVVRDSSTNIYPNGLNGLKAIRRLVPRAIERVFQSQSQQLISVYDKTNLPRLLPTGVDPFNSIDAPFDRRFPNSIYVWELFFHVPWLIADHLTKQQRFADAERWLRYIFDPMTAESPDPKNPTAHYWKFLPFRRNAQPQRIDELLEWLANPKVRNSTKTDFEHAVETWKDNPFRPHEIARTRIGAYQWRLVISYVENLLAWADQLFTRDTRESINEATQLYVLAAQILGPRPKTINRPGNTKTETYRSLESKLDKGFSNAWIPLADQVNHSHGRRDRSEPSTEVGGRNILHTEGDVLASIGNLYFCVPTNEKLLELWDRVEDRLFKVRNSLNIEGVARELALFEPPIDPELLVRATAAGLSIEDILAGLYAPPPHYRFQLMLQKSTELCAEVKSLGASLLLAMEKRDAEHIALLRAGQEVELLKMVEEVRKSQVEEAERNMAALEQSRKPVEQRFTQLQILLGRPEVQTPKEDESRPVEAVTPQLVSNLREEERGLGMIKSEQDQLARMIEAQIFSTLAGASSSLGALFHLGAAIDPALGELNTRRGRGADSIATMLRAFADYASSWASRDAIMASYQRRRDEWKHQSNLAIKELQQIDKQILAAQIRKAVAEKELANTWKQIEQSSAVAEFLHSKFTNKQLYSWMESQIAGVYFHAYQLAYRVARGAERAFQFEIGDSKASFLKPGYWDSLKKGLLAGERLAQDLKRMEVAYLERNRRDQEIAKHISLRQINGLALMRLRTEGKCEFEIPEAVFDLDFPGHYFRRIKSVSISVPCVVGPYTSVSGTLTLLSSKLREKNVVSGSYADESNYRSSYLPIQSISTSSGQNDSGLFDLNFRDERYLPFEGAGAMSRWKFTLPKDFKAFDYDTISDVILHIRYTAREGDETLKDAAVANLSTYVTGQQAAGTVRLFSIRHEFPTEWAKFQGQTLVPGQRFELALGLRPEHYPFWSQGRLNSVTRVDILARSTQDPVPASLDVFDKVNDQPVAAKKDTLAKDPVFGGLLVGGLTGGAPGITLPAKPTDEIKLFFNERAFADLWIAVTWSE